MKNIVLLATGSALLLMFTFTSCKKKGCTEELAINYVSKAKKDDGSCSYSSTKMIGAYTYVVNGIFTDTAIVYSYERSHMKVEGGYFDYNNTNFQFLVTWSDRTMAMPDSLVPIQTFAVNPSVKYRGKVAGKIVSKDNFTITYVQEIPTWNNPNVKKDTVITYDFKRI